MRQGIREVPVNFDLTLIYDSDQLVGRLRRGLDGLWYPELPGVRTHDLAKRDLLVTYHATKEFAEQWT